MAKWICRKADRFDPTGMPRPRCCVRRATPPSHTAVVHELSQRDTDAFIFGERCPDLPRPRTRRAHSLPPNSRRATPPICPDLNYDRHSLTRSVISTLRSRQRRRRSSSSGVGALTIAHTRGSPRFYARSARTRASPPILSVFARRRPPTQRTPVVPVGLPPPAPTGCRYRGRIDDVAFDPFILQHAIDPESVEASLLNDDEREDLPRPGPRFLPNLHK